MQLGEIPKNFRLRRAASSLSRLPLWSPGSNFSAPPRGLQGGRVGKYAGCSAMVCRISPAASSMKHGVIVSRGKALQCEIILIVFGGAAFVPIKNTPYWYKNNINFND